MRYLLAALAVMAALTLSQQSGLAQQMTPHEEMMGTPLEGVISAVRFVSCGDTPQSCQGIFDVTPAPKGEMMMQKPAMAGEHMMMEHPVTIIIVPGTGLAYQNSQLPLTRVHVGDKIACEYVTRGNMNIATKVTVTQMGMGHM